MIDFFSFLRIIFIMKRNESKIPRWLYIVLSHAVIAGVFLLCFFFESCLVHRLTGLPCPGCGMTRAYVSMFRLDFASAWYYHPLAFFLPLPVMYLVHRKSWHLPGNKRISLILLILLIVSLVAVYIARAFIPASFVYEDMRTSVFS